MRTLSVMALIRRLATFAALAASIGCSGENRPEPDARAEDGRSRQVADASSSRASDAPLCDRIDDDAALTPSGAEPLQHPGVEAANSESRCMVLFGVDMPIGALRSFYRTTLGDLGYEITSYRDGDGIVTGNLSRTFLRATKPGRQVNLQIDEFDPAETTLARHAANVKLQIDAMRD